METIVERSATLADSKTRPAWGGTITNQAAPNWCCTELAPTNDNRCNRRAPSKPGYLPHGEQPMAGIKIGRMAEEAWPMLKEEEKVAGMPLWRLAALANFKFLPIQGTLPMGRTPDGLFVYPLVPADRLGKVGGRQDRFGRAYVEMGSTGPVLKGIRLHDQLDHILVTVGTCIMSAPGETQSSMATGIMEGPDELPSGWVYRRKDKNRDIGITRFINVCLKKRNIL